MNTIYLTSANCPPGGSSLGRWPIDDAKRPLFLEAIRPRPVGWSVGPATAPTGSVRHQARCPRQGWGWRIIDVVGTSRLWVKQVTPGSVGGPRPIS